MDFGMVFRVALRALARNKMRSSLTMLGIVIGVCAVIAMVGVGQGAEQQVQQQIESFGTNTVFVSSGSPSRRPGGAHMGSWSVKTLTVDDMQAIEREIPLVSQCAPGGMFGDDEVRRAQNVVVLGKTVADLLFVAEDPVGQTIRVKNQPFQVIGVLAPKGQSPWGDDQDDRIFAPYTTVQTKLSGQNWVQFLSCTAISREASLAAQPQIEALRRERHRIRPGSDDDFQVRTQSEVAQMAEETSRVMTMLLGSIASISLLVGGIGIMNIMLVSVTERTREIGIRMAVGARRRDIMLQFIVEAVVMAALGGALGIVLGVGSSDMIHRFMEWPGLIRPEIIAFALLVSGGGGFFFGFSPAQKASRLDPIEALRYE